MSLSISKVCSQITPSVTLKLNAAVAEMKKQGLPVIGLGAGEPDYTTPPHISAAAKQAIDAGRTFYTAAAGLPELRRALVHFLKKDKGLDYDISQAIITTGAKQALLGAFLAVLDPGDEVLLPTPCWVSYPEMIRMAGGIPVMIPTTKEQGFVPSIEQLRAAVTPRTKAMLLNTPSNPTGAVWNRQQLQDLADLAVEKEFYVISDEIYEKLVYDGAEHICIASLGKQICDQTVVISGFSKAYAMTGWRMGYATGPKDVIAAMASYQSHATGNPNTITQYAGIAALTGDQECVEHMRQAFSRRRQLMVERISRMPLVSCFMPHGAFYVMLDVRGVVGKSINGHVIASAADFAEQLLNEKYVASVPCEAFGAPGFCRLSYAISDQHIAEAMDRLESFLNSLT
ncbi:MAG: aspartate aminotransferase [Clostridiales bacterium]|nr:aspartate aminotransferase [Clostridiales bacterium]